MRIRPNHAAACAAAVLVSLLACRSSHGVVLSAEKFQQPGCVCSLSVGWQYHAGDDPRWADPTFDDSQWEPLSTLLVRDHLPKDGWPGQGWFRLRLEVDSGLVGQPLRFTINHLGASEVYLDGDRKWIFGKVGTTAETEESLPGAVSYPKYVVFDRT